jgi:aerobic-type carbon monoxide dehydrogenase small subunit (CoxS/CutS family)/CO/xanthine dehydrogenase FAD-binding subunit
VLARGIRSYHRPTRLQDALDLAARGVVPLAGGTRLLSSSREVANVLDLTGIGLDTLSVDDGDLVLGSMVTLQDIIDSRPAYELTAGLLPAACHAFSPSRMLRNMATIGGEAVESAMDSEVAAALLALNAVFTVSSAEGPLEVPGIRFLKRAAEDLAGGALLQSVMIPGAPGGAAFERAAPLVSGPAIVSVAATVTFAGTVCSRARIAVTGLPGPPARIVEAESEIEGTAAEPDQIEESLKHVASFAAFRSDAHATADFRRKAARALAARALARAIKDAQAPGSVTVPRLRPRPSQRAAVAVPYFTSGRIDVALNGQDRRFDVEARTTLLELVRRERLWGARQGCDAGDCGACTVLLDGRPVTACLTLALRAHGRNVQTVEALGGADKLHPVQEAFLGCNAVQCGYCTPALELCGKALLDAVPTPTEEEVRDALAGCLCRCGMYNRAVRAILDASGG